MKKLFTNPLFQLAIISGLIFSCQKKQIGFFNNHTPNYKHDKSMAMEKKANLSKELETYSAPIAPSANTNSLSEVKKQENSNKITAPSQKPSVSTEMQAKKLSKEEKKEIKRILKKQKTSEDSGIGTLILVIIAIILPPIAVLIVDGLKGPFWLSILLTLLFYLPGLIYALWRIFRR